MKFQHVYANRKENPAVKKFWMPESDQYLVQVPTYNADLEPAFVDVSFSEEQARHLIQELQRVLDN